MKDEEIIVQEQQDDMSLPENAARELNPGEKYVPILKPDKTYPEITPYSVQCRSSLSGPQGGPGV